MDDEQRNYTLPSANEVAFSSLCGAHNIRCSHGDEQCLCATFSLAWFPHLTATNNLIVGGFFFFFFFKIDGALLHHRALAP